MAKTATMKVWNVELGLAVHIKAPNGKYIVIDLGSMKDVSPLRNLSYEKVGYMVITHPHYDHFSDIENIGWAKPDVLWRVKNFSRTELMQGVSDAQKAAFKTYCDLSDTYNSILTESEKPNSGIPFDGLVVEVYNIDYLDKSDKNNFSAVVILQLGKAKVVVCGDNTIESLTELMKNDNFKEKVKDSYVLVAPHHGRESGYYKEFVELVNPYLTIISDTSFGSTSVTDKYSCITRGWNVYNRNTNESEQRKCISTRNDGNLSVTFGESDEPDKFSGVLNVSIHV